MSEQLSFFAPEPSRSVAIAEGAVLLGGFALVDDAAILAAVRAVVAHAPFRTMVTPGGASMSVTTSNCGALGWVSDRAGYRYEARDPTTGAPWPAMPEVLFDLARRASSRAGFAGFEPDACLVNRYAPGTRMGLHQDKDERDLGAPIVSVSLGLPATFVFGGLARTDAKVRVPLVHGDVVVFGGASRLCFHGVLPVAEGDHPHVGRARINLTFRRAS